MEASTSTVSSEREGDDNNERNKGERRKEQEVTLEGLRKELGPLTEEQLARIKEEANELIDEQLAILTRSTVTLSYQINSMHNTVTRMQNRIDSNRRNIEKLRTARLKLKL